MMTSRVNTKWIVKDLVGIELTRPKTDWRILIMKISELVEQLEAIKELHGDILVQHYMGDIIGEMLPIEELVLMFEEGETLDLNQAEPIGVRLI